MAGQLDLLRRIGKHAYVLIYLVMQSRPVSVAEMARDLDICRETALVYLRKLAAEQAVTRTRYGWLPTVAGRQLVLPAPVERRLSEGQVVDNSVDKVAENPPPVEEIPPPLIINKESLIKDLNTKEQLIISDLAEKPPEVAENPAWGELRRAKILRNRRTEGIYTAQHLTAEHIQAAERHLRKRYGERYTAGLLISMLETIQLGDKPIGHAQGCICAACQGLGGQGYAGWEE